jgi:hypothetical protein
MKPIYILVRLDIIIGKYIYWFLFPGHKRYLVWFFYGLEHKCLICGGN